MYSTQTLQYRHGMTCGWSKQLFVSNQISSFGGPGTGWIWVIAISIFGVSFLGIFAACSERVLFLKLVRR